MLRRCTGENRNLLEMLASRKPLSGFKFIDDIDEYGRRGHVPCDCGLEYDDTERSVIYPHNLLPKRLKAKEKCLS